STFSGWIGVAGSVAGVLIGLFFLFIFIWVIVWFARSIGWISRASRYSDHNWRWWDHDDALEILRERYAKGEISKDQYDKMREDMGK
ncbi:MAG: SHOCT domain-containing protein, partial [Thermoplasmatales archaeon]|nr:SHOCT domain-containing protein [Thermoplasmatales archaeon]